MKTTNKVIIKTGDFFCGAGGGTSGLLEACEELGIEVEVDAVNHWDTAIETHSINHPNVRHWCENLESVWPRKVVPGGKLHIGIYAPECPGHSKAKGAKPVNDQSRATAWHVVRFIEEVDHEIVIVENVPEFVDWGPLYPPDHPDPKKRDRPIPEKKGLFFRNWIRQIKLRGYKVEWRILNSAHYGAATARPRFFLQAKKQGKITWPEQTHAPQETITRGGRRLKKYEPASKIIDWSLPGQSIYGRKKPLVENTMRRIYAGIEKYGGLPFVLPNEGYFDSNSLRDLNAPLQMLPWLVVLRNHADARSLDDPLPTLCASGQHFGLAQPTMRPFLTKYFGGHDVCGVDDPLPSICANYEHYALTTPYLISFKGQDDAKSLDEPLPTQTTRDRFGLCSSFVVPVTHQGSPRRTYDLKNPLPVITTAKRGEMALVRPCLVEYYGTGGAVGVDEPLPTVTTKDRFALVDPRFVEFAQHHGEVIGWLDILFRMLQPHELSAAMGFRKGYFFAGNREDQVRQIGNAIVVDVMKALCMEALKPYVPAAPEKSETEMKEAA